MGGATDENTTENVVDLHQVRETWIKAATSLYEAAFRMVVAAMESGVATLDDLKARLEPEDRDDPHLDFIWNFIKTRKERRRAS